MVDPVTLIVLVAAGEVAGPTASAMVRATHDALGGATVDVRETRGQPTDEAALAAEGTFHPDAVVELIWDEVDRRRVTLRVHMVRTQRWLERSMTYLASDPIAERGRTLGLAIASILPEIAGEVAPGPASASAPGPASPSAPSSAPGPSSAPRPAASAPRPASASASPSAPSSASGPASASSSVPPPASASAPEPAEYGGRDDDATSSRAWLRRPRVEVAVLAIGAAEIGGTSAIGGGVAVDWFPVPSISLRLGASERSGSLDAAEASLLAFTAASGVAFHPWRASRSRPIDLSVRGDYLLVRQSATHFDSDDPSPATQSRWLSGVDAFVDAGWLFSSDVAAVVGLGLEDVLAATYVNVRQVRKATIPPVRVVAEFGVCLRF
jgi:hypothetical protein